MHFAYHAHITTASRTDRWTPPQQPLHETPHQRVEGAYRPPYEGAAAWPTNGRRLQLLHRLQMKEGELHMTVKKL